MKRTGILTGALATVVLVATMTGAPVASARPAPAVVATWHVAPGGYDMIAGLGAMWAVRDDGFDSTAVYRIDPDTNASTYVTSLPFPTGGVQVGFGSLWFSDYYGNAVERMTPDGTVQATIPVGLQPEWLDVAFGSVWVSNHHGGSVSRIDPTSNSVVATVPIGARHTFRNGPQSITHDATRVYVGSSNAFKLQSIDPTTNTVSSPPTRGTDNFCQSSDAIDGVVWSLDTNCSGLVYIFRPDGTQLQAFDSAAGFAQWMTDLDGAIWLSVARSFDPNTSIGSQAVLEQRDPSTGAVLATVRIGGDATHIASGYGDIWVFDAHKNTIRRVHV